MSLVENQRRIRELDELSELSSPDHFVELLERYDDEISLKPSKPMGRQKKPATADPLYAQVSKFIHPTSSQVDFIGLTKHMHPNLVIATPKEVQASPEYSRIKVKVSKWRKRNELPERKNKEFPISEEGRKEYAGHLEFLLKIRLKHILDITGIPYEEARDIGNEVIDEIYAKEKIRTVEKPQAYITKSVRNRLISKARLKSHQMTQQTSLDAAIPDGRSLHDLLAAPNKDDYESEIQNEELAERVFEIARKRKITPKVLLLWGLVHLKGKSLQKVGEHFNISRYTVRDYLEEPHQTITRELKKLSTIE